MIVVKIMTKCTTDIFFYFLVLIFIEMNITSIRNGVKCVLVMGPVTQAQLTPIQIYQMFSKIPELGQIWLTNITPVLVNISVNLFLHELIH
jgi:hypothetical protein